MACELDVVVTSEGCVPTDHAAALRCLEGLVTMRWQETMRWHLKTRTGRPCGGEGRPRGLATGWVMGDPILASRREHTPGGPWRRGHGEEVLGFGGLDGNPRGSTRSWTPGGNLDDTSQVDCSLTGLGAKPSGGVDVGRVEEGRRGARALAWRLDTWRTEAGLVGSLQNHHRKRVSRYSQKPRA